MYNYNKLLKEIDKKKNNEAALKALLMKDLAINTLLKEPDINELLKKAIMNAFLKDVAINALLMAVACVTVWVVVIFVRS